jgi:hypothetical protein
VVWESLKTSGNLQRVEGVPQRLIHFFPLSYFSWWLQVLGLLGWVS